VRGAADGWSVEGTDSETLVSELARAHVDPPIEQTPSWEAVDEGDPDRETAGHYVIRRDGETAGTFILTRLVAHRLPFFWVRHGPVWFGEPDAEAEAAVLALVADEARTLDPKAIAVRLDMRTPAEGTLAPQGLIAYDRTVVVDTGAGVGIDDAGAAGEAILATFKPRGRRDVRKAVRESGLECADETGQAARDFSEYHAVMAETAGRDGFVPWDADTYRQMIRGLGRDHCRVYAGRIDGRIACWSIVTISGSLAARYYAASETSMMRRHVTDRLVFFECQDLARRGVRRFDLMGIGSDLAPELMGLNEFKTKFSRSVVDVAAARELPLRPAVYQAMSGARTVVRRLRSVRGGGEDR
jgi:hypothetical protein